MVPQDFRMKENMHRVRVQCGMGMDGCEVVGAQIICFSQDAPDLALLPMVLLGLVSLQAGRSGRTFGVKILTAGDSMYLPRYSIGV